MSWVFLNVDITLIAPPWYPVPPPTYGGIELVVAALAQELVGRGHDVTVVACGGSTPAGVLRAPFPAASDRATFGDVWHETRHALAAYRDLDGADIVHDHSGIVGPAIASMAAGRQPVVHTLHGPWTDTAKSFYPLVDEQIHLVAVSATQREANLGVRYAATIHNGIDVDAYAMNDGARDDSLVFIGRACENKNAAGAIRIARATGRPLRMVVKRSEPIEQAYWQQEVEPLLGADVEVLEDITEDEKVEALGRAHAMVFPIRWPEPFGLVMIEAMACGTPVVAGRHGAAREVVDDGRTGFLCDTEEQMAKAMNAVGTLDRGACRRRVTERFSATAMADRYERLYRSLV